MNTRVVPILCLLALLCSLALNSALAQGARNPFLAPKQEQAKATSLSGENSLFGPMLATIAQWQLTLRDRMAGFAKDIRHNPYGRSFWLFMLCAFLYGCAHSLGPGHGKVFAASYFLNRPGPLRLGFLFGNLTMFIHVLSAASLVLTAKFILEASTAKTVDQYGATLQSVSYALLLCLGILLLTKTLFDFFHSKHTDSPNHAPQAADVKSLLPMALAAGLVPCPGAAMVLIFSISLGITAAGLWALACISLGMGLTISTISVLVLASRSLALRLVSGRQKAARAAHFAISLAGALLLILFGGVLLWGTLLTSA